MTIRSTLKALLPRQTVALIARTRAALALRRFERQWASARRKVMHRHSRALARLLIVPSDPVTLVGALGDAAMIGATIEAARAANPAVEVEIVTQGESACSVARTRGLAPMDIWSRENFPEAFAALLNARAYDAVVLVGADIMDGYYSPMVSAKMIAAADLAARSGASATLLGFSFNAAPAPALSRMFERADARVRWNLRDAISLERFRRFCRMPAVLVADSAFALQPGTVDEQTGQWIAGRRAAGRMLIGFNIHPMLFKSANAAQASALVARAAQALGHVSRSRPIALLLLVHDHRGQIGDAACLRPLYEMLEATLRADIRILDAEPSAAVLKDAVGRLDGIVSGRMHLAIAALGMGVPALCLTYQDKFEGLFAHFGLPRRLLLPPAVFAEANGLEQALLAFIDELPALRATIESHRAGVLDAARQNFAFAAQGRLR